MADSSASAPCVYTLQAVKFIERYLTRRLVAWNGTKKQWFNELSQFNDFGWSGCCQSFVNRFRVLRYVRTLTASSFKAITLRRNLERRKVFQFFFRCLESVSKYLAIKVKNDRIRKIATSIQKLSHILFLFITKHDLGHWHSIINYQRTKRWWRDLGCLRRKTFPRYAKCGRWKCCSHPCPLPYQRCCCCCSSEFRDVHRWFFDGMPSGSSPAWGFRGSEALIWRTCRDKRPACSVIRPQFPMCWKQKIKILFLPKGWSMK